MSNLFDLKGFQFDLRARKISIAQSKVSDLIKKENLTGLEINERVMFMCLKGNVSQDDYYNWLDELSDDDYAKLLNMPTARLKEVGKSMTAYTKQQ